LHFSLRINKINYYSNNIIFVLLFLLHFYFSVLAKGPLRMGQGPQRPGPHQRPESDGRDAASWERSREQELLANTDNFLNVLQFCPQWTK